MFDLARPPRRLSALACVFALGLFATSGAALAQDFEITAPLKGKCRPDFPGCEPIFLFGPPSISGDYVVFTLRFSGPGDSVWSYRLKTGKMRKLAGLDTDVPGGRGKFTEFGPGGGNNGTTIGGNVVAFFGRDEDGTQGLYTVPVSGGDISRIATTKTKVPGSTDKFQEFRLASLNGETITFGAISQGAGAGIYSATVLGTKRKTIIDGNDRLDARIPSGPVPDYFNNFVFPTIGERFIQFQAGGLFDPSSGANAIFRTQGGFSPIADNLTRLEGGGPKNTHVRIITVSSSVGSDAVAFHADEPNTAYAGIFKARSQNAADKFVSNDDVTADTSAPFFSFSTFGYDDTGLAFTAVTDEGGTGVTSVFFVPAPGATPVRIAKGGPAPDYFVPTVGDRSVSKGRIVFFENGSGADTFYLATPVD